MQVCLNMPLLLISYCLHFSTCRYPNCAQVLSKQMIHTLVRISYNNFDLILLILSQFSLTRPDHVLFRPEHRPRTYAYPSGVTTAARKLRDGLAPFPNKTPPTALHARSPNGNSCTIDHNNST